MDVRRSLLAASVALAASVLVGFGVTELAADGAGISPFGAGTGVVAGLAFALVVYGSLSDVTTRRYRVGGAVSAFGIAFLVVLASGLLFGGPVSLAVGAGVAVGALTSSATYLALDWETAAETTPKES